MRALLQRVSFASVINSDGERREIGYGLMILLGIEISDTSEDVRFLSSKILKLRIFDDEKGIMNLPVTDVSGEILVVSQFTLHADTKKGNRPSYIRAARPEHAIPLYEEFIETVRSTGLIVKSGWFGAHMQVELNNDGPVTIMIDSRMTL
ncbi:MAG: D-aminoacyl-tRNA deacylase [Omnitrophica WOR_2 bacterium]